jgi:hypothetical protein
MKIIYSLFAIFMLASVGMTSAQIKQVVVWDGETVTKGAGWANPASTCSITAQKVEAHSGNTALEFRFKGDGKNGWLGCGWDWVAFQVGEYGTDITAMKNFTFWLKVKGTVADFSFNLLCNGAPALDQPQHHTEKVIVSKYCPEWKDGQWHQIIVPLKDLIQPNGFDAKYVAEMQFFNTGAGDGSFFIDDLVFNDSNGTTSIQILPQTETEYSVNIFPNPVDSYLTIKYSLIELSPVEFMLFDMKGKLFEKQRLENMLSNSGEFKWIISHKIASGEYFISMRQGGIKVADCKLIKL